MPLVESITMFAQTAPFILLLLLSLIEENSLEDYQCVGIRREDRSYDFKLPPDVDEKAQTDGCDAEWTVDKYTRDLTCSCTNATDNPVFSTPPSRERSSSGSSKRQHYCAIAVAVSFVIILGILAFFICRTNSTATYAPTSEPVDEQNHA